MELFQRLLNKVQQGYKETDKRLGGFLPGGGTGNPLSNVVRQINPTEVAALYGANMLNEANKKISNTLLKNMSSAPEKLTMQQLPALMDAASTRMKAAGFPGTWSPFVPGREFNEIKNGRSGTRIDLSGGGFGALIGSPAFVNSSSLLDISEPTVYATKNTPGWVIAHELGHALDAIKRPYDYSFPKDLNKETAYKLKKEFDMQTAIERYNNREMIRKASPGVLVAGGASLKNDDRSLFSAGIEGALGGLGANQQVLRKEIMADRFGMPIAKEAGVPWNTRQNILAKSTYALGATVPGFSQGVIAELLGRGADALGDLTNTAIRAFQGPQLNSTEQALVQYGYDPSKYKMSKPNAKIKIEERNNAEQTLYNYIRDLK